MSERRRTLVFAALVTLIAGGAGAFLVWNARGSGTEAAVADRASILEIVSVPHIVFLTGGSEKGRLDHVAIAPLADLSERAEVGILCDRIGMAAAGGICIRHRTALGVEYRATFVDNSFAVRGSSSGPGIPSRARTSPDGRYAAATSFVTGDSYLVPGEFSTTTTIYDPRTGKVVERTLERFMVIRDGQRFEPRDRNFWGVTFAKDGSTFFATMGTGAHTYLVRGDLAQAPDRDRSAKCRVSLALAGRAPRRLQEAPCGRCVAVHRARPRQRARDGARGDAKHRRSARLARLGSRLVRGRGESLGHAGRWPREAPRAAAPR